MRLRLSRAAAAGRARRFLFRLRCRHDDYKITRKPAASCAIRLGSEATMARFWSALALPHSAISASERPQPVQ